MKQVDVEVRIWKEAVIDYEKVAYHLAFTLGMPDGTMRNSGQGYI
jgi:hypothetical protein